MFENESVEVLILLHITHNNIMYRSRTNIIKYVQWSNEENVNLPVRLICERVKTKRHVFLYTCDLLVGGVLLLGITKKGDAVNGGYRIIFQYSQ